MALNTSSRNIVYVPLPRISRILDAIHIPTPRPRTLLVATLLLGGLSIPALMAFGILPLTFLIGFAGFVMTITGGTLALIFCGEI